MTPRTWSTFALLSPALAFGADGMVHPPGEFRIERADLTIDVARSVAPKGIPADPQSRHCKVRWVWGPGGAPEHTILPGCAGNLQHATAEAAAEWSFELDRRPEPGTPLLEAWFRFPLSSGEPATVWVRQRFDATLRLVGPGVGVMGTVSTAAPPPQVPAGIDPAEAGEVVCTVHIDVQGTGMTHRDAIEGCDEPWSTAVREALGAWRFRAPDIDGEPSEVGLTAGVTFTPEAGDSPGELSWAVAVAFPRAPDQGDGAGPKTVKPASVARAVEPTWDPYVRIDDDPNAEVGIYDLVWPEPTSDGREHRCPMLWQVDSRRRVIIWPEEGCDPAVQAASLDAAHRWNLKHGAIEPGERFARFHGTFLFPADGAPVVLLVAAEDLVEVDRDHKDRVRTYTEPQVVARVPPKLPPDLPAGSDVVCELELTVGVDGKPDDIQVSGCDGSAADAAVRAVKRWRWDAAEEDGVRRASQARVRLKFSN